MYRRVGLIGFLDIPFVGLKEEETTVFRAEKF